MPRVGVLGFCMGGALALGALAKSDFLACGTSFYGVNRGLFEAAELRSKPVEAHFGRDDRMEGFSDAATGRRLLGDLRAAGNNKAVVHLYENLGHAFMNDSPAPFASFEARKEAMGFPPYDEEQAEEAWERVQGFFELHLRNKPAKGEPGSRQEPPPPEVKKKPPRNEEDEEEEEEDDEPPPPPPLPGKWPQKDPFKEGEIWREEIESRTIKDEM